MLISQFNCLIKHYRCILICVEIGGIIIVQPKVREMENSERLAIVETELKQLNKTITAMNEKLDIWNQSYLPRNEIYMMFEVRDKEIKAIQQNILLEEESKWSLRRLWPAWLGVVIAAFSWLEKLY